MRKLILHLFADTGSDSQPYRKDPRYRVLTIGSDIGVENIKGTDFGPVHGVILNPICREFSPARYGNYFGGGERLGGDVDEGMKLVYEGMRVVDEANPRWWVMENPAAGRLRDFVGPPNHSYQPWQYGSPWTKRTGLWGSFNMPEPVYDRWEDVPKLDLYARPGRKPSLAFMHKSAFALIPEFRDSGMPTPDTDMEFRSLCSQRFAQAFKEVNP